MHHLLFSTVVSFAYSLHCFDVFSLGVHQFFFAVGHISPIPLAYKYLVRRQELLLVLCNCWGGIIADFGNQLYCCTLEQVSFE